MNSDSMSAPEWLLKRHLAKHHCLEDPVPSVVPFEIENIHDNNNKQIDIKRNPSSVRSFICLLQMTSMSTYFSLPSILTDAWFRARNLKTKSPGLRFEDIESVQCAKTKC